MNDKKLDSDEREILDSFERGEWKPVEDLESEIRRHQEYARNSLKKDKRVNIRISSKDLEALQTRAIEDGIPYQTLMSSILHRYITGRLVDKESNWR